MNSRRIERDKSLAVLYPEVAVQWHPIKNGDLTPDDIGSNSSSKVWWICKEGHEWQAQVRHRAIGGNGCPYCSGRYPVKGVNDLETIYPELAKEWNQNKNGKITPREVTAHSSKKVWWRCEKGHEWQAAVCHRAKNHSGCPYCSGRYPVKGENDLETLYPDLVKEWNYGKNGSFSPSDCKAGSNKKVWWICSEGHEWQTLVYHRTSRGTGCPYCSGNIVIPGTTDLQTLFPEISCEFDVGKNGGITPVEICAKSGKKIWWLCGKGHSWQAPVISRTNLGAGCPICAGQRTLPRANDLATLRPDLAAEWHPSKNRNFKPSDCTVSSGRKIWWRCKEGHEWQSVVSARTGKDNCGCPYCYGRYAIPGVNDLKTVKPELALEWHPTKNRTQPSQVLPNSNKKAWWLCPECGYEWRTLIPSRSARGSGCPRCAGRVK